MQAQADYERNPPVHHPERSFPTPSQVNATHTKGITDLDRYAFITNNSQEKDASTSTSLTSPFNALLSPSNFPFSPAHNGFENPPHILRTGSRQIFLGPQQARPDDFPFSAPIPGFGQHLPHELQYTDQTLQDTSPRDSFDLETSPYGRHENGHTASTMVLTQVLTNFRPQPGFGNFVADWSASPVTPPMYSRPASSSLKATSPRTRTRTTPRHQHHQYLDSLLRSKCPKDRLHALNVAIQFRDEHHIDELIPNDLLDELLEAAGDDKFYCFCCPRARKARTITPARDHVRKSLGNFPFQCSNPWCQHSSLRQADLNKHMKTCVNTTVSQ